MTFIFTMLFTSCRKEEEQVLDTVESRNEAVNSFVDKNISADEEALTQKNMSGGGGTLCGWTGYFPTCADISEDNSDFPKIITVNFGDGCTGPGGYTRAGIMYIHLTAPFEETGSVRTVTFEDFSINGVEITGSRITTNLGPNTDGQPVFSRVVDTQITHSNGTYHRNFTSEITWLSGYQTSECGDNDWKLTGSGSNTRSNGTVVTRTITSALYHYHTCNFITQGSVQISAPNGTMSIDYGNGTCDDLATVTGPNGNTITVNLNP